MAHWVNHRSSEWFEISTIRSRCQGVSLMLAGSKEREGRWMNMDWYDSFNVDFP